MQDRKKSPYLLSILILLLGTSAHCQTRYVAFPPNVFRIFSNNQIEMVTLPLQPEVTGTEFGSSSPQVSPDSGWIAFTRNFDLWLCNTGTGDIVRATHVGRPYSQTFASVEVLIVTWSADSSKLLIKVIPGDTECVECGDRLDWKTRERKCLDCGNRGDWKQRKASYGYAIYGVKGRSLRKAILPSNFRVAAWLPNGRFLGMDTLGSNGHIRTATRSGELYSITEVNHVTQMDVSADGAELLVTINEKENANDNESSSHISRVSLSNGKVTRLTPVGNFAEFQTPRISPAKKQNAWVQQVMPPSGKVTPTSQPTSRIVVNGKPILDCSAAFVSFEWLDEHRVAASCYPEILVLEAYTGRKLASTRVPVK